MSKTYRGIVLLLLFVLASLSAAHAATPSQQVYVTKDGYFMALSEGALVEAMRMRQQDDTEGIEKLLERSEIGLTKPDIEVTLYQSFPFKGICQVIPVGAEGALWTEIECLLE